MGDIKYIDTGTPVSSPYSPGLVAGNTLYVSGQVPVDKDGKIPSSIEDQTAVVLANLKTIIEKAGSKVGNVVRCTVFMRSRRRSAADPRWEAMVCAAYSTSAISSRATPSWIDFFESKKR